MNNTETAKLYLLHPGDEVLMVYDEFPYEKPESIPIRRGNVYLWIKLKMTATKKAWKVNGKYTSKFHPDEWKGHPERITLSRAGSAQKRTK